MSATLLPCLSPEQARKPYAFKMTGIRVFSFEEALFHCFNYWKRSLEDYCGEEFIEWVGAELGLADIASRIRNIARNEDNSQRLYSFLTLIDYFPRSDLYALRDEVSAWERKLDWEKLKERGDYFMTRGEAGKALAAYRRALKYGETAALLNNSAVALMRLGRFAEASNALERAIETGGADDQKALSLHLAEAYILGNETEKAAALLAGLESEYGKFPDSFYLRGEIERSRGDLKAAARYYADAIGLENRPEYIYGLAEIYADAGMFDKALEVLGVIEPKDAESLKKRAELYVGASNISAAIKCIEEAIAISGESAELWTRLATCHRLDYNPERAGTAITRALRLSPEDGRANLEAARIKKAEGKLKDYQLILAKILDKFKTDYRAAEIRPESMRISAG